MSFKSYSTISSLAIPYRCYSSYSSHRSLDKDREGEAKAEESLSKNAIPTRIVRASYSHPPPTSGFHTGLSLKRICHLGEQGWRSGRALAPHQCGPGSIPGIGVICGLSLLVLYSAPRGFSPGTPVFPSPLKPTLNQHRNIKHYYYYYYLFFVLL